MDVIVLRSLTTLFMFLVFVGIVVWSLSARRRQGFDEAAQLPFLETPLDDMPVAGVQGESRE
jgi:cytochrome c oxidase cbb3-type subunit 4